MWPSGRQQNQWSCRCSTGRVPAGTESLIFITALSTQCTQCRLWIAVYQRLWGLLWRVDSRYIQSINSKESWHLEERKTRGDRHEVPVLCLLRWHELRCASLMKLTVTVMRILLIYPKGNDLHPHHLHYVTSWTRNKHWTEQHTKYP